MFFNEHRKRILWQIQKSNLIFSSVHLTVVLALRILTDVISQSSTKDRAGPKRKEKKVREKKHYKYQQKNLGFNFKLLKKKKKEEAVSPTTAGGTISHWSGSEDLAVLPSINNILKQMHQLKVQVTLTASIINRPRNYSFSSIIHGSCHKACTLQIS